MSLFRKIWNVLLILLGIAFILAGIFFIRVNDYEFQTDLTQRLTRFLSKKLNTEVQISRTEIDFFHQLVLKDVLIKDLNNDTLLYSSRVYMKMNLFNVWKSEFEIASVELNEPDIYLHRTAVPDEWNFQFVIDALSSGKKKKTSSSTLSFKLERLQLNETHFVLLDEPNNTRLNFELPETTVDVNSIDLDQPRFDLKKILIDEPLLQITKLENKETDSVEEDFADTAVVHINTQPIQLVIADLEFRNSKFNYDDENEPQLENQFDGVHQSFQNLNLHFTNGALISDTISARIENISGIEKSGFVLTHLEGNARITTSEASVSDLLVETPNSKVHDFFSFSYVNFHSFFNFNSDVIMTAGFRQSDISMKDVAFFVPAAKINSERILVEGVLKGSLDNLKARDLKLVTGSSTRFLGDISLKGLPDANETYMDFQVTSLITNANDIRQWIPGVKLPPEISRLGSIQFNGSYSGFFNDFVAYGEFNTQLGKVTSDLNMKFKNGAASAEYSGNVATTNFDLGRMTGQDSLIGKISLALKVSGSGFKVETMNAAMNGTVSSLELRDYNYKNISLNGTLDNKVFNGIIKMSDENIRLDFSGLVDFHQELPVYDFKASIDSANLRELKFSNVPFVMSTKLDMNMSGKNIDEFLGYAKATEIVFLRNDQRLRMDSVTLRISQSGNNRSMVISSQEFQSAVTGNFTLTKLPSSFLSVIDYYFPSIPGEHLQTASQDFDFSLSLGRVSEMVRFFTPGWRGSDSTKFTGHFNSSRKSIDFSGNVPALGYRQFEFGDVEVNAQTRNDSFKISVATEEVIIADSIRIMNPSFTAMLRNDSATLFLKGSSRDGKNYVNLHSHFTGDTSQLRMHILPSDLVLNSRKWEISKNNLVTYSGERLIFESFRLKNEERSLEVKNVNLRVRATNLQFDFENIPIGDFHDIIHVGRLGLDGKINGSVQVLNVFNTPRVSADATINDFNINGKKIENVTAQINYIPEDDQMTIQAQFRDPQYDLSANGTFYPRKKEDQLNLDLEAQKVDVGIMEALFFEGLISNTEGIADGALKITGTPSKPVLTGRMNIQSISTTINYLQTTYSCFNTPVIFSEHFIDLGRMTLFDENGDSAVAKGEIQHDNLDDFNLNISVSTNRFLALNTSMRDDSLFYGTAEVQGIIRFLGPVENLEIRASVQSLAGTNISIPIGAATAVGYRSFIHFVNKRQDSIQYAPRYLEAIQGLRLNFDLEITPEAIIQIIFDAQTGDIIKGSGYGNIRMEIDTKGDFNMFGNFSIESGDYLFTQFNFFNKYFTIERGGSIVWTGDPYGAQIDITAIYSTNASLYQLVSNTSAITSQDQKELQQRQRVDLYLRLSGLLFSPDISFDIKLPEVTSVSSAANIELQRIKQDENELNQQVFGILVLGHFLPQSSGLGNQSISSEVTNSLSEFISNQISYLASQIRSDVDFTVNYQTYDFNPNATGDPNSLVTRNEWQVAITKRFLNNRLSVDLGGNFDFGNSSTPQQSTTGVAGDFAVEYKIVPDGRVSAKVYSTSDYDIVDERNKTRNGVALKYTREFDNIKEFFKDPDKQKRKEIRKEMKRQEELNAAEEPPSSAK